MKIVIAGLYLVALLGLLSGCAMPNGETSTKRLLTFQHEGTQVAADVILPESYVSVNSTHYPVLYLLDGYWNKQSIAGVYRGLRFDNVLPEIIIVSIEYPDTIENVEDQRMKDLTPKYDKRFEIGGGAETFLQVITQQLVPFIETNYRVDRSRTILTGHSLAGLFTLYAMYENPEEFTHYAAISPSALWADEYLKEIDNQYSKNAQSLEANVFITYGTDEYVPYVEALKHYIEQIQANDYDGLDLSLAKVEGMRHLGMTSEGFVRGIAWAFSDLRPEGPSTFEKMHIELREKLGPGQGEADRDDQK